MIEKGSLEDIFYVEGEILPNSRGGYSSKSPLGVEDLSKSNGEVRFPWEKPTKEENEDERKWTAGNKSSTALAELTLPESKLRRLRNLTYQIKTKRKTGGLVIWRSGTSVSLYRGVSYEVPSVQLSRWILKKSEISTDSLPATAGKLIRTPSKFASSSELDVPQSNSDTTAEGKEKKETGMLEEVQYEDEVNKLLEGLLPRYTDWPGLDPLPVDADLLPGIVPVYQPPIRILPYGVRQKLAAPRLGYCYESMIKLWEKSSIAKIALERGVQLTSSEEWLKISREKIMREVEIARHANLVRKLESKLVFAERELMKAGRALSKVEEFLKPAKRWADPESITDEERFMFRRLGLMMKAFLLLESERPRGYDRLDASYLTDDDDTEDEADESYIGAHYSENEVIMMMKLVT
ncbi:hypothetical protein GH714_020726 [Hevea brasiliensis]|uniref:Uncharacterized protein n=1 Tax=Hevea brasiliensis TaxID=3981 RepID=A0A6A6MKX2_HEVBR|nr:hypothetical protein GH714_020726 [Hevea brasiliensis]